MRFCLVDNLLEHAPGKLRAVKQVSLAEEYLADHFPRFPVLPGVMMLESMVQAARRLVEYESGEPPRPLVLGTARNIRYGNMVRPGQALIVEVTLLKALAHSLQGNDSGGGGWEFSGSGTVEGQVAVQGKFSLVPLAEALYGL